LVVLRGVTSMRNKKRQMRLYMEEKIKCKGKWVRQSDFEAV